MQFQLYDLEADIGETQNVLPEHPETAAKLREILTGYIRNGRSTPGAKQKNNGQEVWDAILWIEEEQGQDADNESIQNALISSTETPLEI